MVILVGILGSVTPPGRSLRALEYALGAACEVDPSVVCRRLNLADYRVAFADGRPPEAYGDDTARVVSLISDASAVLLMSPVYRGSLSGSLKNLLDHLPIEALRGKPCGIVAVGATPHHFLGVDWHLRDILGWFGALIAPVSVYLSSTDFADGSPNEGARKDLRDLIRTLIRLCPMNEDGPLGPVPFAARRQ
jgi:NAD(P)H-dependent FMN reductase